MKSGKYVRCIGGQLDGKEWLVQVGCGYFIAPEIIKSDTPISDMAMETDANIYNRVYNLHEWHTGIDQTTQWYAVPDGHNHYNILDILWNSHQNFSGIQRRVENLEVQVALDHDTIEQLERNNHNLEEELAAAESIITLLEITHGDILDDVRLALETDPDE